MPAKLIDRIPQASEQIRRGLAAGIRRFGFDVEAGWKIVVPVRTGQYRNSIEFNPINDLSGEVSSSARHSVFLEFGTKYISARHYLTKVMAEKAKEFERVLADEVEKALR